MPSPTLSVLWTHRDAGYRRSARTTGRDLVCSKRHQAGQHDSKPPNPTSGRMVVLSFRMRCTLLPPKAAARGFAL